MKCNIIDCYALIFQQMHIINKAFPYFLINIVYCAAIKFMVTTNIYHMIILTSNTINPIDLTFNINIASKKTSAPGERNPKKCLHQSNRPESHGSGGSKMIAVIFEVEPQTGKTGEYLDIAAQLLPIVKEIDGFISIERFESLSQPGKIH